MGTPLPSAALVRPDGASYQSELLRAHREWITADPCRPTSGVPSTDCGRIVAQTIHCSISAAD